MRHGYLLVISRLLLPSLLTVGISALVSQAVASPPKLVVAIVVDQLRYDYLERFSDQFGEKGFRLLMEKGAFMTFAHYSYSPTVTGPGHASSMSGAPPAMHGIIGNDWLDKTTLKLVNCVSDPSVGPVGLPDGATDLPDADGGDNAKTTPTASQTGKRSPRNFIGSNFADELRLRYQSKVVGISLKDRGAILPAGKKPTGAYWFDSASGHYITSTYYTDTIPEWVSAFNAKKIPATFIGKEWTRLRPESDYPWPDNAPGEFAFTGEKTPVFDHVVAKSPKEGFETIVPTPFGDQLMVEFALAALEGEKLGTSGRPDLLTLSFSSLDACGHRFGPYSHEVQDVMLRLDQQLARLFAVLDEKIGLSNVMIALTADHGVAPAPEFAAAQGLDGQRTDSLELMTSLLSALSERFGPGKYLLVQRIVDGNIYFNHATLREKQLSADDVSGFIREWALGTGRFQAVYSRSQLLDGRAPGPLGMRVMNGFHGERSGDVVLVSKPYILPVGGKAGTTHGSPYSYDTHIPVILFGSGIKPGRYADEFYITDIVPTLCSALRMTMPAGAIGKPAIRVLIDENQAPKSVATPVKAAGKKK